VSYDEVARTLMHALKYRTHGLATALRPLDGAGRD